MSKLDFGRLITAMVTPFDDEGEVDFHRAQELAVRLVDNGCDGLAICATTGESPTISYPQKLQLFKDVVIAVDGRAKVIANIGNYSTSQTIEFAQDAALTGVDGLMAVVPYYNKPPQEGLYQHYKAIASEVDLPLIMYNIPGRCVINMEAETTIRLANDCPNIVGIKEASGKFEQIEKIAQEAPADFAIYSGDDEVTLKIMDLGGVGVISTIGNCAPAQMKDIIDTYVAGNTQEAYAKLEALKPLMTELFTTTNPILVKEALKLLDFPVGGLRLPLIDATAQQSEHLKTVMQEVGLL